MTTALAKPGAHGRAMIAADVLDQEAEQRNLLGRYIQTQMQEGTDYGVIPGTKTRTLLKPGAEKLTQLFRCVPRYVIEEKIENWETGLFFYRFSCQVVTQGDGFVVAEGVGSCSTYESRYRWRTANRKCPACGKETIIKQKEEKGGNWLCLGNDKGGCWAKFDKADAAITGQATGRVQNPDLHDQANTVLKMAKKRALVDAAISLARCSDIFTQDVEDMDFPAPARRDDPPRDEPRQPQRPPAREPGEDADEVSPVEAYIAGLEAAASRNAVVAISGEANQDPALADISDADDARLRAAFEAAFKRHPKPAA